MKLTPPKKQIEKYFIAILKDESKYSDFHCNSMGVMKGEGSSYYSFSETKAKKIFRKLAKLIKQHF